MMHLVMRIHCDGEIACINTVILVLALRLYNQKKTRSNFVYVLLIDFRHVFDGSQTTT